MKIIGVTGISGSGTSTAATILEELGGCVVNADTLAHEAILRGKAAYGQIVGAFGDTIIGADGEIDRKALGKIVFSHADKLAALENIIHPQVWKDSVALINEARETGRYPFAVIDAPLLIESGMHKLCDTVVLIIASDSARAERIIKRDGITPEAAVRRLAGRVGDEALKPYANFIIENESGFDNLREEIIRILTP
ncbi:MAG: dephospho-CoA kinase [Defluviitaleaceae bacterium]|nr:dephospho-CoA kinase [Defluviitaleaceae bacterium]